MSGPVACHPCVRGSLAGTLAGSIVKHLVLGYRSFKKLYQQVRQFHKGPDFNIRSSREPFHALAETVYPRHFKSKCGGSRCIPRVGRLKYNFFWLDVQPVNGNPVNPGIGFEDAHLFNGEAGFDQFPDTGML